MREYSLLVARYNRAFDERWITGKAPSDQLLLGTPDIQSLADLGNSFEYVRVMKPVPLSRLVTFQLAIVSSLPCLPLILIVMPVGQILDLLTKVAFF